MTSEAEKKEASGGGNKPSATAPTWRRRQTNVASTQAASKFEGDCEGLKGSVYDLTGANQADLFEKTTEKVKVYVGNSYTESRAMQVAIETLEAPVLEEPPEPPADASQVKKDLYKERVRILAKRLEAIDDNVAKLYTLVWGQCSDRMRAKVMSHASYKEANKEKDGIELLKIIRVVAYQFESQKQVTLSEQEARTRYYSCRQTKGMTVTQYRELYETQLTVLEAVGAAINPGEGTMKEVKKNNPDLDEKELLKIAAERMHAIDFIRGADRTRFGKLLEDLENEYLQEINKYPKTLLSAYELLENYKQDPRNMIRLGTGATDGVAFAQGGVEAEGGTTLLTAGKDKSHIKCFNCQKLGHYSNQCPEKNKEEAKDSAATEKGTSNAMVGSHHGVTLTEHADYTSVENKGVYISKTWFLLDNQSTVDVVCNAAFLTNIRRSDRTLEITCNAGTTTTDLIGDLDGYGTVWYHPNGIANILSLSRVRRRGFPVTYDSEDGNVFRLKKPDGSIREFHESSHGLYYSEAHESGTATVTSVAKEAQVTGTAMVTTVADKQSSYTNEEYSRATLARKIQRTIGRPSTADFIRIVEGNQLPSCPVTRADIMAAEDIFGPDVGSLKGKTVRRAPKLTRPGLLALPPEVMNRQRSVTLCADIMYVNKVPFLVTVSRNLKFGTAEVLENRQPATLLKAIKQVTQVYRTRGFSVDVALMDGEFECLRTELAGLGIYLNTTGRDEHVGDIERYIRTIKERSRCVYNTLPFTRLPARLVVEMVYASVFWLNSFPVRDGVSTELSPRAIVTGHSIRYDTHCQLEFGTYVQTHEVHDNSMAARTTGAIALRPTGNVQGGYYFMSLTTLRRIARNHWTELPMPQDVIDRVHVLARRQRAAQGLDFFDRNHNELFIPDDQIADNYDDDDDSTYVPEDDAEILPAALHIAGVMNDENVVENEHENDENVENEHENVGQVVDAENAPIPGVPIENNENENNENENVGQVVDAENAPIPGVPIENNENGNWIEVNAQHHAPIPGVAIEVENEPNALEGNYYAALDEPDDDGPGHDHEQDAPDDIERQMDERYGPRTGAYNLRPRRQRDYGHLHTTIHAITMTQYSMKKGLQLFGEDGVEAVQAELQQLHDREVMFPIDAEGLSESEKRGALQYLMFLKKKRCGKIKARGCADGRKQRVYTAKEEASSPTVSIEALMLSCVIDAKESRDVATADIPGAFMQADMDEVVFMRLEGKMAELLAELDPDRYSKFMIEEKGKSVVYVQLSKALYGTLRAALLFWRKLSDRLKADGFVINPYDWCVANKTVNGKQCTVLWHVDDIKVSHVEPAVVTSVLGMLEAEFGKETPLTITRGKVHDYLGMTIDYSEPGKVKITMFDYIENMLAELPEDMDGMSATPAADHLFTVNDENPTLLETDKAEMFHTNTAKLLFLCQRARPDVQTPVAFLTTRVKRPDTDDYKKLARTMRYIRGTKRMPLVLEADDTQVVKWWVDASFAVHPDMKGHTGAVMTLGKGAVYGRSTRQKLVTRSSTESELVGVYDMLPQILWTRYFLEAQGYGVADSVVYQDNKSAMLLEQNGRGSSSKRTRHLNIRYFFVTQHIASKDMSVEYCPTSDMVSDYFTKPLQGALFRKMRNQIMNLDPTTASQWDHRSVLENGDVGSDDVGTETSGNDRKEVDGSGRARKIVV